LNPGLLDHLVFYQSLLVSSIKIKNVFKDNQADRMTTRCTFAEWGYRCHSRVLYTGVLVRAYKNISFKE